MVPGTCSVPIVQGDKQMAFPSALTDRDTQGGVVQAYHALLCR